MKEKTIFPREERSDMLFQKILNDSWACEKLQETFCQHLFCNDDHETPLSPKEFTQALFNSYSNRDLSAFLMAICQNTLFDLLRNSFLIPYRFNADGKQNPVVMTDNNGALLPEYKNAIHEKEYKHFYEVYHDLGNQKNIYLAQAYCYSHSYASDEMNIEQEGIFMLKKQADELLNSTAELASFWKKKRKATVGEIVREALIHMNLSLSETEKLAQILAEASTRKTYK